MSIYEVAKRAGVSIATVSRVLNQSSSVKKETREKVEKILKEMNYTPNAIARSLAVSATNTIGVLTSDVRDSFYASAIYTIEQEFRSLGYNVILCNTGGGLKKKKRYLSVLLENKVDGIILVGSVFRERLSNKHILETAEKVPVVMLNSLLTGDNVYSILCDDGHALVQIVEHLHAKGHRNIAYIYDVESFSGLAKLEGFKKGMHAKGFDADSYTILQVEPAIAGGYSAVDLLEQKGIQYTAIVTSEDILAAGVMKRLRELGRRVPQDVSVVGFNNSLISQCTAPTLSTVDNKVGAMATGAVRLLFDVLQGREVPARTVITPELVLRESTL